MLESAWGDFHFVSENGPLSRLIQGRIIAANGDIIESLILQVQKDVPGLNSNHPWSLTNLDVEKIWQNSKAFHEDSPQSSFLTGFSSKGENSVPFRSLFYCGKKKTFFHPVCPSCGEFLELCRDDVLLENAGLQKYSFSLDRYLYCPECCKADSSQEFFTPEKKTNEPECVKDWVHLVHEIGMLAEADNSPGNIPCAKCSEHGVCFNDTSVALQCLIPFSFFPFFMFAHKGPLIPATEFLKRVGGGPVDNQTVANSFLFQDQSNQVFEVLYLKLTFLHHLYLLLAGDQDRFPHPDLFLSLEQIWVELNSAQTLLPELWNFQLSPLEIGFPTNKDQVPITPKGITLYSLGITWIAALVTNSRHGKEEICQALTSLLAENNFSGQEPEDTLGKIAGSEQFKAENIFWHPEGQVIPQTFEPYWQQTLSLGLALVETGLKGGEGDWQALDFPGQVEKLAKAIKSQLFAPVEAMIPAEAPSSSKDMPVAENDSAIAGIIDKIAERYAPVEAASIPPVETYPAAEEETVIMSQETFALESKKMAPVSGVEESVADDERTVILGREDMAGLIKETPAVATPDEEATVIMGAGQAMPSFEEPAFHSSNLESQEHADDDLEKTVIMDRDALQALLAKKKQ